MAHRAQRTYSSGNPAGRALAFGAVLIVVSLLLACSPLILGKGGPIKYIIALALVGFCLGASILLHAAIDWCRGKR